MATKFLIRPFKPRYCFLGIGLIFVRWWNLCRFFPHYWRAWFRYQSNLPTNRGGA